MELTPEQSNAYAARGGKDSWPVLDEQATYTLNLLKIYLPELVAAGLPETMVAAMTEQQKLAAAIFGSRREAQVDSQLATGGGGAALKLAREYLFKMSQVLPIATRGVQLGDLKPEHLIPPNQQSRSVARTKARLDAMRPLVVRLDGKLKVYFGGESAVAAHDQVTTALTAAQGRQAAKREARSPETFRLHVAKGLLIEMIEDVNRIGRVAFRGRLEIVSKFNKEILLRARRGGRGRRATSVGEAEGRADAQAAAQAEAQVGATKD